MANIKIALLTDDNEVIKNLKSKNKKLDIFDNYIKLISSGIIQKYQLIIIDSTQLPFFNEQKIINALNDINRNSRIIFILRDNDVDYLKRIHDNNSLSYILEYPVNFTHLNAIIKHINVQNRIKYE